MVLASRKGFTMKTRISILSASLLIAATPLAAQPWSGETGLEQAVEGRNPGAPVQCIALSRVRSSTIVDGTAILYRIDDTLYVNRPRAGASRLDNDDLIVNRSASTRLCRGDPVRTQDPYSRAFRGAIVLGEFVPYRRRS